jgi:tetratricopeptide (TPR) repeat protein
MTALSYRKSVSLFAILFIAASISITGCGPGPVARPLKNTRQPAGDLHPQRPNTLVFSVFVDGLDVGREVRSVRSLQGPFGTESLTLSHLFKRKSLKSYDFNHYTVRSELTLSSDGTFLRGSYVVLDSLSGTVVSQVGFTGDRWERIKEFRESVSDPVRQLPLPLPIVGNEIIGFRLHDFMRDISTGDKDFSAVVRYYNPWMDSPAAIGFAPPKPGNLTHDGLEIEGTWVTAFRAGTDRIFVRIFFDENGLPLEEHYPAVHQIRRLSDRILPFPQETSSARSGRLFSDAYVGLIHSVTNARFRLVGTEPLGFDALAFLDDPANQKLTVVSKNELELKVFPGSPDNNDPPNDTDLSKTEYIVTIAPYFREAVLYLRSGGKNGSLPKIRRDNASTVVARSALIRNPHRFWKNPDKVAKLVMNYVYTLLPEKTHLPKMTYGVTILRRGSGDCRDHSILFTSFMRALGIPTRLVSGAFLSQGGTWEPHLWAMYWDGSTWRQLDPGNNAFSPGALYVAFGKGAYRFSDLETYVASFLDRSFSGVSFDLIEAQSNGEELLLARPRIPGSKGADTSVFNAAIISQRGDHERALAVFDSGVDLDSSSVESLLFRVVLLLNAGRAEDALLSIASLRKITSSATNIYNLDVMEFRALLALDRQDDAATLLDDLCDSMSEDDPSFIIHKARFLFATGPPLDGISLLDNAIATYPDNFDLIMEFVSMVSKLDPPPQDEMIALALARADDANFRALYTEPEIFAARARLLFLVGSTVEAMTAADHGLVLKPFDPELDDLRNGRFASASSIED